MKPLFRKVERFFGACETLFKADNDVNWMSRACIVVLALLIALIAVPTTASQGILLLNESTTHVDLSENVGHETITLNYVVAQADENLTDYIQIFGTVTNVVVSDSSGALAHTENSSGGFTRIDFDLRNTLQDGDRSTVTIEFDKGTSTLGASFRYEIRCLWGTTPVSSQIIAILPENYELYDVSENTSSTSVSDGNLQLRWSIVQENQFYSAVTFGSKQTSSDNQPVSSPPSESSSLQYVALIAGIASVLLMSGVFLKFNPLKPKTPQKLPRAVQRAKGFSRDDVRKMMAMLTAQEKKVMENLLKKDNITQRILSEKAGIPKATMSRVLQRLEQKGMIARTGLGSSKRVLLTRWTGRWRI